MRQHLVSEQMTAVFVTSRGEGIVHPRHGQWRVPLVGMLKGGGASEALALMALFLLRAHTDMFCEWTHASMDAWTPHRLLSLETTGVVSSFLHKWRGYHAY